MAKIPFGIKAETDPEIIWTNIYTLQNFCARYIKAESILYKFKSEFITDDEVGSFEEECKVYARSLWLKVTKFQSDAGYSFVLLGI